MGYQVSISEKITLPTTVGDLSVAHVATPLKEGLVISGKRGFSGESALVRFQSSCLFSESLMACDCDCALQLQASLERVSEHSGLIIYLYDEGRGAGLLSKVRAVHMQQNTGVDTAAAFTELGLPHDPRSGFNDYTAILRELIPLETHIELLTNNPKKISALSSSGYKSVTHAPLVLGPSPAIRRYLREKGRALGHLIQS